MPLNFNAIVGRAPVAHNRLQSCPNFIHLKRWLSGSSVGPRKCTSHGCCNKFCPGDCLSRHVHPFKKDRDSEIIHHKCFYIIEVGYIELENVLMLCALQWIHQFFWWEATPRVGSSTLLLAASPPESSRPVKLRERRRLRVVVAERDEDDSFNLLIWGKYHW